MANVAYSNAQGNNGTITATAPSAPGCVWNLTSLQISQAGPNVNANAKVTIWDGPVGTGTVLAAYYLASPGLGYLITSGLGASVGVIQDIPLPKSPQGIAGVQASPGNAMNVQVTGTGNNLVSINARFSDGLP